MAEVVVVGTAHVGEKSIEEVRRVIRDVDPDVVAVELDVERYGSIKELAGESGYGVDMCAAIEEAESRGIPVALIDRGVSETLQRVWDASSLVGRLRMVFSFVLALLGLSGVGSVEEVLERGEVEEYVERLRRVSPGAAAALIDERDALMANRLQSLKEEGNDVVAVVGAGHESGVRDYLSNPGEIPEVKGSTHSDVYEEGDEVVVVLDMPGCVEDSMELELLGDELVIEAVTQKPGGDGYVLRGRESGKRVSVEVPGGLDIGGMSYSEGVLEVRLEKRNGIEVS